MERHLQFGPLCCPSENGLHFVRFPQAENSAHRTGGFVQSCVPELRGAAETPQTSRAGQHAAAKGWALLTQRGGSVQQLPVMSET